MRIELISKSADDRMKRNEFDDGRKRRRRGGRSEERKNELMVRIWIFEMMTEKLRSRLLKVDCFLKSSYYHLLLLERGLQESVISNPS